jgi:hypothetical protein
MTVARNHFRWKDHALRWPPSDSLSEGAAVGRCASNSFGEHLCPLAQIPVWVYRRSGLEQTRRLGCGRSGHGSVGYRTSHESHTAAGAQSRQSSSAVTWRPPVVCAP